MWISDCPTVVAAPSSKCSSQSRVSSKLHRPPIGYWVTTTAPPTLDSQSCVQCNTSTDHHHHHHNIHHHHSSPTHPTTDDQGRTASPMAASSQLLNCSADHQPRSRSANLATTARGSFDQKTPISSPVTLSIKSFVHLICHYAQICILLLLAITYNGAHASKSDESDLDRIK